MQLGFTSQLSGFYPGFSPLLQTILPMMIAATTEQFPAQLSKHFFSEYNEFFIYYRTLCG